MITFSLKELELALAGSLTLPPGVETGTPLNAQVTSDSRDISQGDVFFVLTKSELAAQEYAYQASLKGAGLIVSPFTPPPNLQVPYLEVLDAVATLGSLAKLHLAKIRKSSEIKVLAITGSVGKTTTKDLLGQLLSKVGNTVFPVASFNNEIGLPLTVLKADVETEFLVLEMGAAGIGEITYLTSIAPPNISVVLKVGSAHLGGFGSHEMVAKAKFEIVSGLLPDGVAVLNFDDANVRQMASLTNRKVISYGKSAPASLTFKNVILDDFGRPSFEVSFAEQNASIKAKLSGEHHIYNILAVLATGLQLGFDLEFLAAGVNQLNNLSPHRMAVSELASGALLIDDSYNANPDSMKAGLRSLAVIASKNKRHSIAVLGHMSELGTESITAHDELGRLVVRLNLKKIYVVGEEARPIATGAIQEGSWGQEVEFFDSIEELYPELLEVLNENDVILLKGSNSAGIWKLADQLLETEVSK